MYFNLGDRVKLIFLYCTVIKFTALKLKLLRCQSSRKHRMALELLSFIAKKSLIKNISASIAKGSKENQRTFRSS